MTEGISRLQLVLLRGSLRCMLVLGPLLLLVPLVSWWADGRLEWDARVDPSLPGTPDLDPADGATASWDGGVRVTLDDPSASVLLTALLPTAIVCATVSVAGFLLLWVLSETHAGRPFFDASAHRLRLLARVLAAAAIFVPLTRTLANGEVVREALPRAQASTDVDVVQIITWLVVALVVRVIAEAFRIGTQLRDDTEGLV